MFNKRNSSNPLLKESALQGSISGMSGTHSETMTVKGAIDKTLLLFGIMLITTIISFRTPSPIFMIVGIVGGLIAVLVASFKKELSPFLAPVYALFEGLFLGAISAMFAARTDGIIFHALTLTISMLLLMLIIYRLEIIKVTEKLRAGIYMATGSVFILYMMSWVLSFFGISMPYLHQGGGFGIVISLVIIGIAGMNLLLDFDMFEKGQKYGAPKYMEWYAGMGLLVTLVWLYIEILSLLSRLKD